jgi:methyl-accepting chemotaxis protein
MIERTFQWKFVGKFVGIVLAGLVGTGLSLYLALPRGETRYYAEVIRSLATADDALSRAIISALVVESLVISAAVALIAVLTSHKIAGPVFKLKTALDALARMQVADPIRYRENDQLGKTAETFNAMLAQLQERFRSLGEACEDVGEGAGRPLTLTGGRNELKGKIDRLQDALRRFTL